jgi:C-terminal processing protease CtpA/Prc
LDSITDAVTIAGDSEVHRRFVFLVNGGTSLPSMALALAEAGDATIATAGGNPAILAPSISEIDMPYGVQVIYRTGDVPDIGRPMHLPTANSPEEATKLSASSEFDQNPPRPDAATVKDKPYIGVLFPPEPMRMLAIARIYNVIRYFSPYTALMHDDWNAAALQAIDDEIGATDSRSYVLGLMKFYAHLHDSHGYVNGRALRLEFGAGVPFQARYLHREVVVTTLASGDPRSGPLKVGDVIDAVNGVPIRQAMNEVERYICSSTEQAADYAALRGAMQPSVFTGKKGTPITITFHRSHGNRQTITVMRDWFGFAPDRSGPKYFVLPGNVGYVDFDRLETWEVDSMFKALKNTRAIIFDNRGYPRDAAWGIAPRLTTKTDVRAALFDTPLVTNPLDVPRGDGEMLPNYQQFYQYLSTADGSKYLKPTVMLIDERAMSASEHSALLFEAAAHTRFVGTPTSGANGDVTSMVVPGNISLNFSGHGVQHANGGQLQRVGIIPDVRVEPSAADIAAANDVVLQAGLGEALRLTGSTAQFRNSTRQKEVAREQQVLHAPPSAQALAASGQNAKMLKLAWVVNSKAYVGTVTAGGGYLGSDELTLVSSGDAEYGGSFAGPLDIGDYRGKTIRIRGYLSAQDVKGGAGFWLMIDGPLREFDIMQDRLLSGSFGWKPFAIVLRVPMDATQAYAGLLLNGSGTAHASSLTIDVVPDGTPTTGN